MFSRHSQTLAMDTTAVLFLEIPNMQLHYDPMSDSLYIAGSCRFCLYLFSNRNFAVPLFHPAFDPAIPYFAFPLHVAHPAPPPALAAPATPVAPPPMSPPQVARNILLNSESDPYEASGSSSSSGSNAGYSPVGPGMANGFLTK